MIDSRKTGAYISRLRREKDWTQLELADRVHVTPQAVSRWETGDSFPDVELLVQLAQIFNVSVDALLSGEPTAARGIHGKATTGEVVTALSQGRAEQVAKMILEKEADLESVLEAAPITRPSLMDQVVEKIAGFEFTSRANCRAGSVYRTGPAQRAGG